MPSFRSAFPSKFLKADDLATGALVATIARVDFEDVGQGRRSERKLVVRFAEPGVKPMPLNLVNGESITEIAGTDDYQRWRGVAIELYRARTEYQGERVPCIRIRAPQSADTRGPAPDGARNEADEATAELEF
jgi:hypothetical protein